jgi:hypothetical protein
MRNGMKAGQAPAAMPGGAGGAPIGAGPLPMRTMPAQVHQPIVEKVVDKTPAPSPRIYRVLNGGTIVWNGCRTTLRAGKEVSDKDYDIRMLMRQGIKFAPVLESEFELPGMQPTGSPVEPKAHQNGDVVVPGSEAARAMDLETQKAKDAGKPLTVPSVAGQR